MTSFKHKAMQKKFNFEWRTDIKFLTPLGIFLRKIWVTVCFLTWISKSQFSQAVCFNELWLAHWVSTNKWASSWDYGTYHTGDQWRLRRACAFTQSRQSLCCSHTVLPKPLLFAHMKYGSRWKVRPNIRHLASLDGCTANTDQPANLQGLIR